MIFGSFFSLLILGVWDPTILDANLAKQRSPFELLLNRWEDVTSTALSTFPIIKLLPQKYNGKVNMTAFISKITVDIFTSKM